MVNVWVCSSGNLPVVEQEVHENWKLALNSESLYSDIFPVWAGKNAVDSWTVGMATRRLHLWDFPLV